MKPEYRFTELQNANRQASIAHAKMATAPTRKQRLDWAEKYEFWTNKAAFLEHAR